jgi:CheY-like chemotaxis protein/predicted regulator of Ras-like GTPase activity (Roadblock/LC7/MglB family)
MSHIIVVDPDQAFATLLVEELRSQGHDVDHLLDGSTALDMADSSSPDMMMLDMGLKDPDAISLARELREQHAALRLVLVPMIGEQLSDDVDEIGLQGVLPKPFFIPELPAQIQAALEAPLSGAAPPTAKREEPVAAPESEPEPEGLSQPQVSVSVESPAKAEPVEMTDALDSSEPSAGSVDRWGLSYEAVQANYKMIQGVMDELAQELAADCVLLTLGRRMITSVGMLNESEADSVARAVVHGWMTSDKVARVLGCEQENYEQSIAGDGYLLYAISVDVNAILAVVIRGSSPLGLLRHRARGVVEQIRKICA